MQTTAWYGKTKRSTLCIPFSVFVVYFLWSIYFCGPSVQCPVEKCSKYLHCLHYKPETVNFPHDVAFPAALEFHIATCTKQFFQVALKFVFLETTTDWILWFLMEIIRISCFYKNLSDTELILFQTKSDLHCEEKSLLFLWTLPQVIGVSVHFSLEVAYQPFDSQSMLNSKSEFYHFLSFFIVQGAIYHDFAPC